MKKTDNQLRRIGIVGCGAVGSFYGAKLFQAGHDVNLLLRSDFDYVHSNGVAIRSFEGDFQVNPTIARSPGDIGPCDLIIIALKSTANHLLGELLQSMVCKQTALLTLQNGLGNETTLARLFPGLPIHGGMCFVCLNRIEPGVVHHIAHGKIVLGRHSGSPDEMTEAIATLIRSAGITVDISPDLKRAHWEKLVWNIPFNGLSVAGAAGLEAARKGRLDPNQPIGRCLTTDALLDSGPWEQLVTDLMDEVIATGRALGHDLSPSLGQDQRNRTRVMKAYHASTPLDYERGLPLELRALFFLPLEEAQAAGVETPYLAALCKLLLSMDNRRKVSGSGTT